MTLVEYLAGVGTVAAVASVVRCVIAWADRRDRRAAPRFTDRGNHLTVEQPRKERRR